MKNFHFFITSDCLAGDNIVITGELCHKVKNVLRYKDGDKITLIIPPQNGHGQKITGEVTSVTSNKIDVSMITTEETCDSSIVTTLYIALLKSHKFEYAVQKATELGVKRIVPLVTRNSVVRVKDAGKKRARLEAIALEAACQCKRIDIPEIMPVAGIPYLVGDTAEIKIVCYESGVVPLKQHLARYKSPKNISAVVGPEGGFTVAEITSLNRSGFASISLGENILRAETVPVYLMSVLQYEYYS